MRVLTLTKYGAEGASSRYRILQYEPHLRQLGVSCTNKPLLSDGYLALRWGQEHSGVRLLMLVIHGYWTRVRNLLHSGSYDLVFVEKDLFPYIPLGIEQLLLRHRTPVVVDLDDAVFLGYSHGSRIIRAALQNKFPALLAHARAVTVGSHYLAEYAQRFTDSVHLIPTVIDLDRYPHIGSESYGHPFTIGWIGSQSTVAHLSLIAPTLQAFCRTHDARVMQIGGANVRPDDEHWTALPWREDSETADLSKIDVGIMPLPDTEWARGKCAFKLIQYMACCKPVVASSVGENRHVVQQGVNGFLAMSPAEWTDALEQLYGDVELGRSMGEHGRHLVESGYSLQVNAPRLAQVLLAAA